MTENIRHINEDMLVKFLLGETNDEENQSVTVWLSESQENQKQLDRIEMVWIESGKLKLKPVAVDISSAWGKMSKKVDDFEYQKKRSKLIDLRKQAIRFTSGIAALLVLGFVLFQLVFVNTKTQVLLVGGQSNVSQVLSDGSEIALNKNTKIIYPKKFKGNQREVKLEGEAFFKVESDPDKPFIVDVGIARVRVLGTQFNVKAYNNTNIEVIVTEGSVEVIKEGSTGLDSISVLLKAGDKSIISETIAKPIIVEETKPDELFWMNKTLIFTETKLSRVIDILEKRYNIKISVSNPELYSCELTSTFSNSSVDEILEIIAFTFDINLQKQNNTYIFEGEGCASN